MIDATDPRPIARGAGQDARLGDSQMVTWRIVLHTKSLSSGVETIDTSVVDAVSEEAACEIASLHASNAHGRVIIVSCELVA